MLRWQRLFLGLVLTLGVIGPSFAWPEPAFIPLFEGNDLTGWRAGKLVLHKATETPEGRFTVNGNVLLIAAKDKDGKKDMREVLTVRDFARDFVVKLEFKAANEATAVVSIRGTLITVGDFIRRNEQRQLKKFQTDGWNELEVAVKMAAYAEGKKLKDTDNLEAGFNNTKAWAKVNGQTVDPNRVIIQIEGLPLVNGERLTSGSVVVPTKGQIGLRSGSGKVEFRNIRFRELP